MESLELPETMHADTEIQLRDSIRCPSCNSGKTRLIYRQNGFPVHSTLNMLTRGKAVKYPRGDIALFFCNKCGFIFNGKFDAGLLEYCSECEETQGFSPTFNTFAGKLAEQLVGRYGLENKNIIEIGCGKGEFLAMLCELGGNRGMGFDPAFVEGRIQSKSAERILFIKDYYSEKYRDYHADFICCRMTLEHIAKVGEFVWTIRKSIENRFDTILFLQVPDVTRILRECSFEDIYYEHCSYFSPGSLAGLLRRNGFDILDLYTGYQGQYLMVEARPTHGRLQDPWPMEDDLDALKEYASTFEGRLESKLRSWKNCLEGKNGSRTVLWGAGSKAVAFMTSLRVADKIEYVVDINPYRQGTFLPGSGREIVSPAFLREYDPQRVIVMNPVYMDEIRQELDRLSLTPELLSL